MLLKRIKTLIKSHYNIKLLGVFKEKNNDNETNYIILFRNNYLNYYISLVYSDVFYISLYCSSGVLRDDNQVNTQYKRQGYKFLLHDLNVELQKINDCTKSHTMIALDINEISDQFKYIFGRLNISGFTPSGLADDLNLFLIMT
jgi:hypothetical protein